MAIVGIVALAVLGLIVLFALLIAARAIPDVRRYRRIRSM